MMLFCTQNLFQNRILNPSYKARFSSVVFPIVWTHHISSFLNHDSKRGFFILSIHFLRNRFCRTTPETPMWVYGGVRLGCSFRKRRPKPSLLCQAVSNGSVLWHCTRSEDLRDIYLSVKQWMLRWPPGPPGDQHGWCPSAKETSHGKRIERIRKNGRKKLFRSAN